MRRPVAFPGICLLIALAGGCTWLRGEEDGARSAPPRVVTAVPENRVYVVYARDLGGSKWEGIRDLVSDAEGNLTVVGGTFSPEFPTTEGASQRIHNPGDPDTAKISPSDVFVTRLDPQGNIVWSTLIGGRNHDRAYGVALDPGGHVYVAGRAGAGFPVTPGSIQTEFLGGQSADFYGPQDGFVCKLAPDGTAVRFCSYFGTADFRIVRDIAVDAQGDIYVAGGCRQCRRYPPAIQKAFRNLPAGGDDAIVAKIRSDGSEVLWATFLGGSDRESDENSVKLDADGNPVVLLTTESTDIPVTDDAFQRAYAGGKDLYVARLDPETGSLVWASYLGGPGLEETETNELAVFPDGRVAIAGITRSHRFPTTPGAIQSQYGGGRLDAFVAIVSADGTRLLASTLLGGRGEDRAEGAAVDERGNVLFGGSTSSGDFPVTANAVQRELRGPNDGFAVVLDAELRLVHSTFYGGSQWELGRAFAVAPSGRFFLGGETTSDDWPARGIDRSAPQGGNRATVAAFRLSR